jgi:peptidyl-dipeptidase A
MNRLVFVLVCAAACGPKTPPGTKPDPDPDPVATIDAATSTTPPVGGGPAIDDAKRFVSRVDRELRDKWTEAALADWARSTNITKATEAAAAKATEISMVTLTSLIRDSRVYDPIVDQLDYDTARQLRRLRIAGTPAPADPAGAKELAELTTAMDSRYGEGRACYGPGKKNCKDLEALEAILATSRKPKELLAAWRGWHDSVGKTIQPLYERFVGLANDATRGVGFADVGDLWRSRYDMPPAEVVAEADRLWTQVKPLYDQLHCYVRRKLAAKYPGVVDPKGPLPAHVVGNMWAQDWQNIYPLVEPFKGQPSPDVTKALAKQKYDAIKMTKLAEGFFTSLGLPALPQTFWERSMFVKPKPEKGKPKREVVCHASAWDPTYSGDVRIKMCIRTNQEDLIVLHHELGHDYYFLAYHTLPMLYQDGANGGFHEAIGDTIALSITPSYLQRVGLLDTVAVNPKAVIDRQMFVALDKIAFLPWGLLVDKWRWEVFDGKVTPPQYNERWWQLRREYQGVIPPVPRAATDFDPGAKYHIPGNSPYFDYFLATILQFQFHRALCKTAGHTGPIHECSIYGSKEAGKRLQATLALGASKPWPDALEALTGERKMDATAILDYFAPLNDYLTAENKGQQCGW